jgi:hypothetical protein
MISMALFFLIPFVDKLSQTVKFARMSTVASKVDREIFSASKREERELAIRQADG